MVSDLNNSPVSLQELKEHLRVYDDLLDNNLTIMLLAAVGDVEKFAGIDFTVDFREGVPFQIKAAILLTAGRLFENPTDGVSSMPTIAKNLIKDFRWEK